MPFHDANLSDIERSKAKQKHISSYSGGVIDHNGVEVDVHDSNDDLDNDDNDSSESEEEMDLNRSSDKTKKFTKWKKDPHFMQFMNEMLDEKLKIFEESKSVTNEQNDSRASV